MFVKLFILNVKWKYMDMYVPQTLSTTIKDYELIILIMH